MSSTVQVPTKVNFQLYVQIWITFHDNNNVCAMCRFIVCYQSTNPVNPPFQYSLPHCQLENSISVFCYRTIIRRIRSVRVCYPTIFGEFARSAFATQFEFGESGFPLCAFPLSIWTVRRIPCLLPNEKSGESAIVLVSPFIDPCRAPRLRFLPPLGIRTMHRLSACYSRINQARRA